MKVLIINAVYVSLYFLYQNFTSYIVRCSYITFILYAVDH